MAQGQFDDAPINAETLFTFLIQYSYYLPFYTVGLTTLN